MSTLALEAPPNNGINRSRRSGVFKVTLSAVRRPGYAKRSATNGELSVCSESKHSVNGRSKI